MRRKRALERGRSREEIVNTERERERVKGETVKRTKKER